METKFHPFSSKWKQNFIHFRVNENKPYFLELKQNLGINNAIEKNKLTMNEKNSSSRGPVLQFECVKTAAT